MIDRRSALAGIAAFAVARPAEAHHGWGGYDANTVLTFDGRCWCRSTRTPTASSR